MTNKVGRRGQEVYYFFFLARISASPEGAAVISQVA
jgi:hypothetical protein